MREEEGKKKSGYRGDCGGTVVPPQARAVRLILEFFGLASLLERHSRASIGTGRATASSQQLSNFFSFFRIILGQIPTKQIKTTQNKQIKEIKLMGCLPRSARLKSLA